MRDRAVRHASEDAGERFRERDMQRFDSAAGGGDAGAQPRREGRGKTRADRRLKQMGAIFLAAAFAAMFLHMSVLHPSRAVDGSDAARKAVAEQVSTELAAGARIMASDEEMGARDYTISHSWQRDVSKIWVWDYAAEDGDYVQVLVDGAALGAPFMIRNKPVELNVPSVGEVQVLGTRDGGGGITYAVRYELNGTTYFNGTKAGGGNLYTLVLE